MQQGFAMLEVGSCAKDHTKEILLKNIMDIGIGAVSWWIVGHAIANGDDSFANSGVNGVFGTSGFGYINAATVGKPGFGGQAEWFFGLSFAATSATIVPAMLSSQPPACIKSLAPAWMTTKSNRLPPSSFRRPGPLRIADAVKPPWPCATTSTGRLSALPRCPSR